MVKEDAEDVGYWINYAHELGHLEKYEEALKICNEVLIAEDDVDAMQEKQSILRELNRDEEALQILHELIKIDPDDLDYRADLLQTLHALKKDKELLEEAEAVLKIDPEDSDGLKGKVAALLMQDKFKEALVIAEKLVEVDRTDDNSWIAKASCLNNLNRSEEAVDCLYVALSINPSSREQIKSKQLKSILDSPRLKNL